jgi:hypothetical protein
VVWPFRRRPKKRLARLATLRSISGHHKEAAAPPLLSNTKAPFAIGGPKERTRWWELDRSSSAGRPPTVPARSLHLLKEGARSVAMGGVPVFIKRTRLCAVACIRAMQLVGMPYGADECLQSTLELLSSAARRHTVLMIRIAVMGASAIPMYARAQTCTEQPDGPNVSKHTS